MNLPNLLSLIRIALVPVFVILLLQPVHYSNARWWALGIYSAASITDALDGYIARIRNQITVFGEAIDPLADKLLILGGIGALHLTSQPVFVPPLWVSALILFRELVFTGGLVTFIFLKKKMPAKPNLIGKVTTVLQMLLVFGCLCGLGVTLYIAYAAALFTLISGVAYTWRGSVCLARGEKII